ncbi:MAG: S41 family peptidase [Candidatus Omnitrophica bacterium]|nr:S41 family peptidase [Candidatus Omnitrophota bacterium]
MNKKIQVLLTVTIASAWIAIAAHRPIMAEEAPPQLNVLEELKLFSKTIGLILEAYVEDKKPRDLYYEAVKGMMASLDRYCQFIDKEHYELLKINIKGEYAGIGARLDLADGFPIIMEVQPDSAAQKAGLLAQDKIMKVDGVSMEGKDIPEVAGLLRGDVDTALMLNIFRAATNQTMDIQIIRQRIEIPAVKDVRMIGKALGYMHIAEFRENTADQTEAALKELHAKGMKALILDLRGNDGGVMPEAIELAEKFLPEGTKIINVNSKIPEQRQEYVSTAKQVEGNYPIVILVNQGSASAAEIFTASMQESGRARVIGTKTFGKASVQSVIPLDDVTAMKMTTARYQTPKGKVIDHIGIDPDELIENAPVGTPGSDRQTERALQIFKDYL